MTLGKQNGSGPKDKLEFKFLRLSILVASSKSHKRLINCQITFCLLVKQRENLTLDFGLPRAF